MDDELYYGAPRFIDVETVYVGDEGCAFSLRKIWLYDIVSGREQKIYVDTERQRIVPKKYLLFGTECIVSELSRLALLYLRLIPEDHVQRRGLFHSKP